jgi:hypothetical protein
MKQFKQAMKYGSGLALVAAGSMAHAAGTNPLTDALAAVDLATVSAAVGALVLLIIGISMAFKGGDVGKRAVRKV